MISEFVADNATGLRDEDNTLQDWIEIHNPSTAPFILDGWYLTDNATNLTKWRFPNVTLAAGDFIVVFASNKDRRIPGATLHTNFSLKATGEYLALVRPDGATVQQQYAPVFPSQTADRSYGLMFNRTTLLADGANGDYLVPASAGALAANWKSAAVTPAGWTLNKQLGVGFGLDVPGLTITVRAKNTATGLLNTQADAELLLSRATGHSDILNEQISVQPTFNVLGNGGEGHYGNNNPLPLWAQEDYVVRATGTITIPTAGVWTFGINSDDGGKVKIDGATVMDDQTLHGAADHLGSVTLTAGNHTIDAYFWERGGGDEGELYAGFGAAAAWDSTMRLVGDTAGGGLAAFTTPVGTASANAAVRTNIESTMLNVNASCFVRVPFATTGPGAFTSLSLLMRYNDGFAAFLNGTQIAGSNAPAAPVWNSIATASRTSDASLVSTGFNITSALPSLVNGTSLLAVQGMNITAADGTFLVLPEIVAGTLPASPQSAFYNKPTPGGINTAPDSLGKVADTVFLPKRGFYPDAIVTSVPFPVTITTATPGAVIRYTTDGSTPTETNGTVYAGPVSITQTTVLRAAAFKSGWESTNVDTNSYLIPNDIINQASLGAAPGPGWPAPGNALNGQLIDYGMDPDIVNNASAAIGGPAQVKAALTAIPSISLVTDLPNLFNPSTGIYVNPGGRGLAWERPCSMELLNDPAGGFQENCGVRIRGGYSRSGGNPKHAFHMYFRGDYGAGSLDYPLYGDVATNKYNQFDLRTAENYSWSFGGDGSNSFMREEFTRQAHLDMGRPESHVKYVHVYLNGQYWGLYEFDERPEADHCSTYVGGDKANWDVVKCEQDSGYTVGPTDGYETAWNLLATKANPLTAPGVYTRRALTLAEYYDLQGLAPNGVTANGSPVLLDVDALIDYMLMTFWSGNLDGCTSAFLGGEVEGTGRANNWFGARDRTGTRGFLYFVHDFEHCLFNNAEDRTGPYARTFNDLTTYNQKINDYYNPMFLHTDLLDVPAYKLRWHNRVQKHLFNGGALSQTVNTARISKFATILDSAIIAESARWGDAYSATPLNRSNWIGQRDAILNSYLPTRTANVITQLRADGLYPALDGINFTPAGGFIASTDALNMTGPSGKTWYYTTDGSDPRKTDGTPNTPASLAFTPSGIVYTTLVSDGIAAAGATWKYRDPSIDLGSSDIVFGNAAYNNTNWKHPSFDDSNATFWKSGDAELGNGDTGDGRPERTAINIGVSGARYQVLYFRKKFTVTNPAQYETLEMDALIDDGAIFYLNGREVARMNMPGGAVGFTYTNLNALNEAVFLPVTDARLVPSALVNGENTMCVEVHQTNSTSSDISFDLRLRGRKTVFTTPVNLAPGQQVVKARAYDSATSSWSALSEQTFLVDAEPASATNLAISEIQYHPIVTVGDLPLGYNDDTFFEYVELMNIGPKRVDLMGIKFTDGLTWAFDAAATVPRLLLPGQRVLIVGNAAAFAHRHGAGLPVAGVFSGQIDNGGELLTLQTPAGAVIRSFTYDDIAPWPADADGYGPSMVLIKPQTNPDHALPANWRASAGTGNPGTSDAFTYASWKSANAPGQSDNADADNDGLTTFWEYASGGTPGQNNSSLLPVSGLEPVTVGLNTDTYQTLTATIRIGADDLQLFPESGSNLTAWSTADMILLRRVRSGDGTESFTWRHARPWRADRRLFMRLRGVAAP